ncbi:MAG: TetM/TetW/TetO/TetS family tetracycline resistance ribosomal protection protein [Oscillospiraceae bacterium]|nr:TetM/TetW/TetO/TetS family tetracycline resistance ribosomal protection protein [Oscillospiraceae bacterium]
MKCLTIGILAHVDSGKTTLSEGLLYTAGALRRLGRVDHGDAFLDTDALEKERGITIFSKQARIVLPDEDHPELEFDLLDTPGHVDFSAEMERTLSVLDYAILVVSGSEGIQSHTETLWKLLRHAGVPVFLFVNKMDISHLTREELMAQLTARFGSACVDFSSYPQPDEHFAEAVGSCDEVLMEQVLAGEMPDDAALAQAIRLRHVFPCMFGAALKLEGVPAFFELLQRLTLPLEERPDFGARVYKITEDEQGSRLTHLKITGGVLHVRDTICGEEKVNRIRLYSGAKFTQKDEAYPGMICAVTGLTETYPGQGLGTEADAAPPVLEPVLRYAVQLPEEVQVHTALTALRKLEEEDPQLHVQFSSRLQEIHVLLMGEIQQAVLQHVLEERFGIRAEFVPGGVAYKETIATTVEGMGHYEPLRHYAEVRLLLEPGKRGSGLVFSSVCREDALDRNWQRLILTHLREKQHLGVLTGAPITDMKITLTAGRAHKKHTEGGDFRQATYRAVRQGLMQAESVLLEPWMQFRLEIPSGNIGRAMTDLQNAGAKLASPETAGESTILTGEAPAAYLMTYKSEVTEYTRGRGRFSATPSGYAPCVNAEAVIAAADYRPEGDLDNSPDSIFCSHGAGELVKWDEVPNRMHTESYLRAKSELPEAAPVRAVREAYTGSAAQDKELMEIFERTYGAVKRDKRDERHHMHTEKPAPKSKPVPLPKGPEYLLVDGYNIIYAWEELRKIAAENLDAARARLIHLLANYRGYRQCELIVVFDAYRVKGNPGSVTQESGISIVYTKEAETADSYIERISHELVKDCRVRVATSDGTEQIIILGNGAYRMSAAELLQEMTEAARQMAAHVGGVAP